MSEERVAVSRHDPDGTVVDGTARLDRGPDGVPAVVSDLRDADGKPLPVPEGAIIAAGGHPIRREEGVRSTERNETGA